MKNFKSFILCVCSLVAISSFSLVAAADDGGWQIDPALMYMIWEQSGSPTTTTSRLMGDVTVGYEFSGSPLFLGALYDYDTQSVSGSSTTTKTFQNFGPTLGLMSSNFYMTFTYFVSTQESITSSSTTTYSGTSGFQVNLGYLLPVGGSWSLGPQISYKSMNFNSAGASSPVNTLLPYLAFSFHI